MRSIALFSTVLLSASVAFAGAPASIDLNRPGVLDQLKAMHPQRYQAVTAVLEASERVPCKGSELELLKTRFDLKELECGLLVLTSYPAKRHVSFELDGASYSATVILKDAEASVQPALDQNAEPTPIP